MAELLTKDREHVALLQDIKVDKNLPKYKAIDKGDKKEVREEDFDPDASFHQIIDTDNNVVSWGIKREIDKPIYDELVDFLCNEKDFNIDEFTLFVEKTNKRLHDQLFGFPNLTNNNVIGGVSHTFGNEKPQTSPSFMDKIKKYFASTKKEESDEFDVVGFFAAVKGITGKHDREQYVNRVKEYIECIGYAERNGQTALKEKLLSNLIVNKYESVLFANNYYQVLTEEVVVQLAKKSPKGLSLTYLQNYSRMIPIEAMREKNEADKLHVFDNYCVMYYDPDGKVYLETAEERHKRKDPILFGMIAGSNKLYYICDWIDEYCDLTLDKVVEIVGKEVVESGYLKEKIIH